VKGRDPVPLLVTVDAEGDDLWSRPRAVTTENARFLPRFQDLCERHGLRPTYLTAFEMAGSAEFRAFARGVLRRGQGEIGTHLHAWNSPPDVPLSDDDARRQPYLTLYPEPVMREKVARLSRTLEEAFEVPMRSHRAGRWGMNETYARILDELGYRVDSSVTPHVCWRRENGDAVERHAPDYSGYPETPYFVDLEDLRRGGPSSLLEVPVTTLRVPLRDGPAGAAGATPFVVRWLRPNGRNARALLSLARQALEQRRPCLVLALHSSELMPGGSPTFARAEDVEALYRDLEALFTALAGGTRGATLEELHRELLERRASPAAAEA
jgi:peptidoglycan/xylan/chitin deacetylase (PgdA/CDA1 family)